MPPVWLALALGAAWRLGQWRPFNLSFGGNWVGLPGGLLVGAGLVLMLLAVVEMRKQRTTLIPHQEADRLVQTGIFKRTRNPIYLGDTLVLAGLILYWDVPLALPLVPVFVWIIERRFILPEEKRLRRKFRQDFFRYTEKTRRWI
ncbi:MAG: isoprenylcysteine carboxylmethyltransferase family protein [Alphaproteobacteria bacterium]|nr:isoprenylcysteine carboxylmethyltransferase family protein [Alphaproteobacteria bacterium]